MAEVSLVLFITLEVEGELQFMVETQERSGRILDEEASDKLLDAVCGAVGLLPPGEDVTADGSL